MNLMKFLNANKEISMKDVNIKGKIFTEEEVRVYGKKSLAKKQKTLMIIGIILLAFFVLYILLYFISINREFS